MSNDDPVLVVDLDGTLCRTDTLHEALLQMVLDAPKAFPELVRKALNKDKPGFKAAVADHVVPDPESLIYDPGVLAQISQARSAGRKVALVSASDRRVVQRVAEHLDLFDDVLGTGDDAGQNLGGDAKADLLVARYGAGGFDYIGDCATDIPVWKAARQAFSTNPSKTLAQKASAHGVSLQPLTPAPTLPAFAKPYIKALRPHQWSKNILVFLPMLAAQDYGAFSGSLAAFVLFCLMASSVYILNDLVDLPSDRAHPRKCHRPFAAGNIPIAHGVAMAFGLIAVSILLALILLPGLFVLMLMGYFLITLAYSFTLKRKLIIDVITLAGLYTMRIIAGGAAVSLTVSPWLLAFSMFLFYALAAIKRQGELLDQAKAGQEARAGRAYLSSDVVVLQIMAISAGQAAVLVFALYLYSPAVAELYARPEILWLICPVLLYWLSRIAILTHRGHMDDDPIVFAARDRISLLTVVMVVVIMLAAELF